MIARLGTRMISVHQRRRMGEGGWGAKVTRKGHQHVLDQEPLANKTCGIEDSSVRVWVCMFSRAINEAECSEILHGIAEKNRNDGSR